MFNARPMNSREVKHVHLALKEQFGYDGLLSFHFFINRNNYIYVVNKEIAELGLSAFKVSSVGLYFAEETGKGLRLSIEGSQLIGPYCKKKVVELSKEDARLWLKGQNIACQYAGSGYVLVKHDTDFLGSGYLKEGIIQNFVAKTRRIKASD
ncbi:hypothetical protein J4475_02465 [Candidatus Woesearchaeota archaeon]|nr:hypothetical protein [Candidatus Woesearchaeota archaeon]